MTIARCAWEDIFMNIPVEFTVKRHTEKLNSLSYLVIGGVNTNRTVSIRDAAESVGGGVQLSSY